RPRQPNEPFFNRARAWRIGMHGALISAVMIGGFAWGYRRGGASYGQAMAFYVTTFTQLFFSFACRSQRYSLAQLGLFSNPWLAGAVIFSGLLQLALIALPFTRAVFFRDVSSFGSDWLIIFLLSLAPATAVELGKMVGSKFRS